MLDELLEHAQPFVNEVGCHRVKCVTPVAALSRELLGDSAFPKERLPALTRAAITAATKNPSPVQPAKPTEPVLRQQQQRDARNAYQHTGGGRPASRGVNRSVPPTASLRILERPRAVLTPGPLRLRTTSARSARMPQKPWRVHVILHRDRRRLSKRRCDRDRRDVPEVERHSSPVAHRDDRTRHEAVRPQLPIAPAAATNTHDIHVHCSATNSVGGDTLDIPLHAGHDQGRLRTSRRQRALPAWRMRLRAAAIAAQRINHAERVGHRRSPRGSARR